jgi:transcriptional regulator with XRE-family HTH domain
MATAASTSSSLQAARQRLGAQLRELRLSARLSGRQFAAAADCQPSKVSQVEKGIRPASVAEFQNLVAGAELCAGVREEP